jgi:hypothetical protein
VGIWGIAPSEFWQMTLAEWWLVYDAKIGERHYGTMRESEVEELYQDLQDAIDKESKRG